MKRRVYLSAGILLLVVLLHVICNTGMAEGLLPQLDDVYGVGMPSLGDVLSRYPDVITVDESGNTIETYNDVSEEDYQSFGQHLSDNGCEMADYSVDGSTFKATVVKEGHSFIFEYDAEQEKVVMTFPEGSYDERVDAAEKMYTQGNEAMEQGDYATAYSAFSGITDFALYKDIASIISGNDSLLAAKWTSDMLDADVVTLGSYEQDNDESNGKEPIEWIVIGRDGNRALLLSKYVLLPMCYNDDAYHGEGKRTHDSVTWQTSTIRKWLNNTFTDSFTKEEKSVIITADEDVGTIFLLSERELEDYMPNVQERICSGTPYAVANELDCRGSSGEEAWWWLRDCRFKDTLNSGKKLSQSNWCYEAGLVYGSGEISDGSTVSIDDYGIRPAFWIDTTAAPPASWLQQQKDAIQAQIIAATTKADSATEESVESASPVVAADETEASYLQALSLMDAGNYEEAYDILIEIRDYNDSQYLLDYNEELFTIGLHKRYPIGGTLSFGVFNIEPDNRYGWEKGTDLLWEIIEYDGNKALICTTDYVDEMYYNNNDEAATNWSKCSLRKWLNGTFYKECFSSDDKKLIFDTKLKNPDSPEVSGGPDTTDKVFISDTSISGHDGWAWIRMPGSRKNLAMTENGHGGNAKNLNPVYPMMWIDLVKYDARTYTKVDPAQSASSEQPTGASSEKAMTMQKGSKGEDVKRLQQALIDQGYLSGSADGQFGKMTDAAVKAAQEAFGLEPTGIADAALLEKLYN